MRYFEAEDSNEMASKLYPELEMHGITADSRNGRVLKFEEPVVMCYTKPWQRANFTEGRNANPFFHIAESMWMLAGRNDVEFLSLFNSNMVNYSDDGKVFNAAYGYRARFHWGHDQLKEVVAILRSDPDSRQAVVQLWDHFDLTCKTKDKACNMSMVFSVVKGDLQLTVFNRSNDAVFGGVTGANPVHFSYFQQWVANQIGRPMGKLYFISNNLHVYLDLYTHWFDMKWERDAYHVYPDPEPLCHIEETECLCDEVIEQARIDYVFESFHLENVVKPIINSFLMRKFDSGDYTSELMKCEDSHLYQACSTWFKDKDLEKLK